jgi:hypothetical protein
VLTSKRYFIAREFGESSKMRKHMTSCMAEMMRSSISRKVSWHSIDWKRARRKPLYAGVWQIFLATPACKGCKAIACTFCQTDETSIVLRLTVGQPCKGCLLKCLSCMTGNCHVQFLGGNRAERPVTYPISIT